MKLSTINWLIQIGLGAIELTLFLSILIDLRYGNPELRTDLPFLLIIALAHHIINLLNNLSNGNSNTKIRKPVKRTVSRNL